MFANNLFELKIMREYMEENRVSILDVWNQFKANLSKIGGHLVFCSDLQPADPTTPTFLMEKRIALQQNSDICQMCTRKVHF